MFIKKISILIVVGFLVSCSSKNSELISANKSDNVDTYKSNTNDISSKINSKLVDVFIVMKAKDLNLDQASTKIGVVSNEGKLLLDIGFSNLSEATIDQIKKIGVKPITISKKYKRMSASVSTLNALKEIAKITQVSIINPEYGSITH